MKSQARRVSLWLFGSLGTLWGCTAEVGGPAEESNEAALFDTSEKAVRDEVGLRTTNGLRTINGLSTTNGLIASNGLSVRNGLTVINGLPTLNGLVTRNGAPMSDGQSVNCTGKSLSQCTGTPDGLLSNRTGLMRNAQGVETARYMVSCALPIGSAVRVKRRNGKLVTLRGSLGFAPEWETGQCDSVCQQKVTSCLLARLNGAGEHVEINLTAAWAPHGTPLYQVPSGSMKREAVFFGNVFTDPPEAYVAVHRDWAISLERIPSSRWRDLYDVPRMCSGAPDITPSNFATEYQRCPVQIVGAALGKPLPLQGGFGTGVNMCWMEVTDEAGQASAGHCRSPNGKTWEWPLTTFINWF